MYDHRNSINEQTTFNRMSRSNVFGLLIAALAVSSVSAPSFARSSGSYWRLRSRLVTIGWHPLVAPIANRTGDEELIGDTREMYDSGLHEVRSCSGIGFNYCFFEFKRNRFCKTVETQGELSPDHTSPVVLNVTTHRCRFGDSASAPKSHGRNWWGGPLLHSQGFYAPINGEETIRYVGHVSQAKGL
jgi:hypothetical protein